MPYTPVKLFATQTLGATDFAVYPAAKISTRIDRLAFSNPSTTTPVTVTVNMVESGGTAGVGNQIAVKVLNVGESWSCSPAVNGVLAIGDFLSCKASTAGIVVVSGSGTQIS